MSSTDVSDRDSGSARSSAEVLFFRRLEAAGGEVDIDALCAERPDLSVALRELDASYRCGLAALGVGGRVAALPDLGDARYEIVREIESGGMGTVFEVRDRVLQRSLAMKVARASSQRDRRQARLRNEARVLGQLVHPGIVPMHDLGETVDGEVYFTMQLVRGRDLGEIMAESTEVGSPWTRTRLVAVLHRVCDAVAYAHSRGVLHRDLKPSNVMVGPFGETYVLDWGLAKIVAASSGEGGEERAEDDVAPAVGNPAATLAGEVVGTPSYMAPEQAAGGLARVDERSDVYSAGAVLYHVLGGRRPYSDSDGPLAAIRAVQQGPPTPLPRSVPLELVAIASRAMARDPAARYATMRELASDLGAYLEGRVVRAHRTGALVELEKWVRRNKGFAAAILAVVVGLATVLALQLETNEALRRRDYRSQIALAGHAYERDDIRGMKEFLARCPEPFRGWEWRAIHRLADTSIATLAGHEDAVLALDLAPDGRMLATGGRDSTLRFWDVESGVCLGVMEFDAWVAGVAFVDDRRVMALADGRFFEVDAGRRTILRSTAVEIPGSHPAMRLSRDRTRLLIGHGGCVEIRDAASLRSERVLVDDLHGVGQVAWSADGRLALVAGRDRETDGARASLVRVFDADTGRLLHALAGHDQWIESIAASPDGNYLASSCNDGRVLVWDLATGGALAELPVRWPGPTQLAWNPDDRLFTGGWPSPELWNVRSLQRERVLVGLAERVSCLLVRPPFVIASGTDGVTKVWRPTAPASHELGASSPGRALALRPGTSQFAVGSAAGHVEIWDAADRVRVRTTSIPCARTVVAYSAGGRLLLTGDRHGRVGLFDADTDEHLAWLAGLSAPIVAIAAHPTLPRCAIASIDATVRVLDFESGTELFRVDAGDGVWPPGAHGCAFSADGELLAVAANDGRLRLVRAATGEPLAELCCEGGDRTFAAPVFSPAGDVVFARVWGRRGRLVAWDVRSGRELWSVPGARRAFQSPVCSADGSRVFACSENGALLVIDAATGERFASLRGPSPLGVFAAITWRDVIVGATERGLGFWDGRPLDR
ncbi:MAG: protein kinase [Planctomycetes bacterium]|nr:protein kinase [Planctomycetota bacterium]